MSRDYEYKDYEHREGKHKMLVLSYNVLIL